MIAARKAVVPLPQPKPAKSLPLPPPSILGLELGRCENTRVSVHAQRLTERIVLQCVLDPGHAGACMYENPSNRRKK